MDHSIGLRFLLRHFHLYVFFLRTIPGARLGSAAIRDRRCRSNLQALMTSEVGSSSRSGNSTWCSWFRCRQCRSGNNDEYWIGLYPCLARLHQADSLSGSTFLDETKPKVGSVYCASDRPLWSMIICVCTHESIWEIVNVCLSIFIVQHTNIGYGCLSW